MIKLKSCPFCGGDKIRTGFLKEFILIEYARCECGCEMSVSKWNHRPAENRIKAEAFIDGAEWQEGAQAFDYDIGIDTQREKAAAEYANKLEEEE